MNRICFMAVGQNARQPFLICDKKVFVTHFLVFACMNLNVFIAETPENKVLFARS